MITLPCSWTAYAFLRSGNGEVIKTLKKRIGSKTRKRNKETRKRDKEEIKTLKNGIDSATRKRDKEMRERNKEIKKRDKGTGQGEELCAIIAKELLNLRREVVGE